MRILAELENGPAQKRVGLNVEGRQPVREGARILDGEGEEVGCITSGTLSPTLKRPIAMGYVATPLAQPGTSLKLEQRGKLSLADDVRKWIPELPDYGRPIRVQDLLQHTSGFRDFQTLKVLSGQPVSTMPEFLALIARQRLLNFAPGAQSEYSHTDYGILGLVVERVAGEPFSQFLEREIFAPMGMPRTVVHDGRGPQIAEWAAGHERPAKAAGLKVSPSTSRTFGGDNVYSSIEDLAGWDRSFTHPTAGGATAIARMLSRPVLPNGETIPYAYGIRLGAYRGLRTVSRGGHAPGSWTEMIRFPEQHLAVAVLCNADDLDAPRFARSVADLYLAAEMSPLPPKPVAPSPVAVPQAELLRPARTRPRTIPGITVRLRSETAFSEKCCSTTPRMKSFFR